MTNFIKTTTMIAVFMLLCASVVAQNEKSNQCDNANSSGVTLANNSVKLKPGSEKVLKINLLENFLNPLMIYFGQGSPIIHHEEIKGNSFTAKITKKGETYSLAIKAKEGIKKAVTETIYIRAIGQYIEGKKRKPLPKSKGLYGTPVEISITP